MDQRLHLFPWGGDTSHFLALTSSPQLSYRRVSHSSRGPGCFSALLPELPTRSPPHLGKIPLQSAKCSSVTTVAVDSPDLSWSPGMQLHSFIPLTSGIHYPPRQVCNEGAVAPLAKSSNNFFIFQQVSCKAQVKPNHCNISGFKRLATKRRSHVVKN